MKDRFSRRTKVLAKECKGVPSCHIGPKSDAEEPGHTKDDSPKKR